MPHRKMILACISSIEGAEKVFRTARRRAENSNSRWHVLFLQNSSTYHNEKIAAQWRELETNAYQTGASECKRMLITETAGSLHHALSEYRDKHLSLEEIVLGHHRTWPWDKSGLALAKLLRSTFPISVSIITVAVDQGFYHPNTWRHFFFAHATTFQHIVIALLALIGASLLVYMIDILLPGSIGAHNRNKPVIYLLTCALVAGRIGLWPGIITALGSFAALNWLFTDPELAASLSQSVYVLNLALFLSSAILIAVFVGHSRKQGDLASAQIKRLQSFLNMYQVIDAGDTAIDVAKKLEQEMRRILHLPAYIFLSNANNILLYHGVHEPTFNYDEQHIRDTCWNQARATGHGTDYKNYILWHFEPLVTHTRSIGILAVDFRAAAAHTPIHSDPDFYKTLGSLADQISNLIDKADLQHRSVAQRNLLEKETLRSMLLSSISHDLQTPLVSMMGYLGLYKSRGDSLSASDKNELINTALQEAERLKHFISNVLDLSKLESGGMKLKNDWHEADGLIKSVIKIIERGIPNCNIIQTSPIIRPDIQIYVDQTLFWQALQNIIENACHHTPQGTTIEISWGIQNDAFRCAIRDNGNGIPAGMEEKIFDKYTRIEKKDYQRAHTGLGLAISRAIVLAHYGWIKAENHPDGGAIFIITLPQWRYSEDIKTALLL